jgi:hypothetical protein
MTISLQNVILLLLIMAIMFMLPINAQLTSFLQKKNAQLTSYLLKFNKTFFIVVPWRNGKVVVIRLRTIHQMVGPIPKPCVCGSFSAPDLPFF